MKSDLNLECFSSDYLFPKTAFPKNMKKQLAKMFIDTLPLLEDQTNSACVQFTIFQYRKSVVQVTSRLVRCLLRMRVLVSSLFWRGVRQHSRGSLLCQTLNTVGKRTFQKKYS